MDLPSEQEINPEGNSYDGQTAVDHFLGKTREQIKKELAARLHWYFYEDFIWMGCRAFSYYFPAVADYVTTAEAKVDYQVVENFCGVIESRLRFDCARIRESFPAIVRFTDYVLTHFSDYGYDLENEDLRQRLGTIKQQCAEPGAAPNGGAVEPQRNSEVGEGPLTVS
jgi:hypothetical protein